MPDKRLQLLSDIGKSAYQSWLDQGNEGTEADFIAAMKGATFTPDVSSGGVLTWTNNGGLENPAPISIKGPKGDGSGVDGLVVVDGKLYLTAKGEITDFPGVTLPAGGGGGGSSSDAITLTNLLESNMLTVAYGSSADIKFSYASEEDAGNGTAYIYVGSVLKATKTIVTGENTIDIGQYLNEGTNAVKITCSDMYSNSRSLAYTIEVVALKITSTFDDAFRHTGDIAYKYTPYGAVEKTVHFIIDGTEVATNVTSESGKQITQTFSALTHGTHSLKVYITATVDGVDIKSDELVYDFMCIEEDNTTALISSTYNVKNVTQGDLVSIPFIVYDPVNTTAEVTLTIKQGDTVYSTGTRTVDRTKQTWSTRDYPAGETTFEITYGSAKKSHIITVAKSNINVSVVTNDLELQLLSANRSNEDTDKETWSYGDVTTTFSNVSWVDTGWVADQNGDTALRLFGHARAEIAFKPFATDARQYGRTIELDFAIRDVNNRDAVVISCMDAGVGFEVTADRAALYSEQKVIDCRYKDEERIKVAFTIEAQSAYRMMSVYLNGVLSGVLQYPTNDNFQQAVPVNISIGSDDCSIDFYGIRAYSTALTQDDIKTNFIADTPDIVEKTAIYSDNDIYDTYGALSYDKILPKIPVMVITGDLPGTKGDKKDVTVQFIDPVNTSLSFYDTAVIDIQGTSSQW